MISSFSNPGFPHVHAHLTHLPTIDARLSAVIDSLKASMCAEFRAIRDSALALCKAVDSAVAPICRNLALLHHDLALVHSIPPLLISSPLLRAMTNSPVQPPHSFTICHTGSPNGIGF
ncbi:hypothetical protein D8674_033769 [Pyrus ussuriensis x Pyrus communis]|uniref:Uncharacterized protein n=1 Tax=Pyrus ussuriensis x Pyrus communis TaxID=2448454 RepID=A0A5N5I004_9ROSA|nr:hypothetical protein D8674_033769 [Pyrus ussuriensis x Pyrus communis]